MRVVAGKARGRRLKVPGGGRLRPTGDRVKEALFSILGSRFGLPAGAVLDLFAGTGSLGIEALSRGATQAVFVEKGRRAASFIRSNLARAGLSASAEILNEGVESALAKLARQGRSFSLLLADPPYDRGTVSPLLKLLGRAKVLAPSSVVVVEHSVRELPQDRYGGLALVDRRRYGDTCLSFYRVSRAETAQGERLC